MLTQTKKVGFYGFCFPFLSVFPFVVLRSLSMNFITGTL